MDPKVNGQIQREWGWLIALYLYLGGLGAGAYTIAGINSFLGKMLEPSTQAGLWIGFWALAIGSLCLLADLGSPTRAVLAGMKPRTSWIARGFWIISAFMILAFVHAALVTFTDAGSRPTGILTAITVAGIILAVSTMAYTGILLGASKGITFWRSGAVPVVFVVSGLVTGHFAIMIGLLLLGDGEALAGTLRSMAAEAAALVVVEVLAIAFFLQAAWKLPDSRESAERVLRNRMFVLGYVLGGLVVPLVLMLMLHRELRTAAEGAVLTVAMLGSLLGLAGGLILRESVLMFGALPTLNLAGFQFRRCERQKEPKPAIGLLPPQ